MSRTSVFNSLILAANITLGGVASQAFAARDMLTPDEVKTTGIAANPANDSGVFLGAGLKFGQARTSESGATPGLASFLYLEPGYQVSTGSWSRLELSAELFGGSLDFRLPDSNALAGESKLSGLTGAVAKIGHGYSLGSNIFGVVKAGLGLASASYKVDYATGEAAADRTTGLVWSLGWQLVAPVAHHFYFTAGLNWTQYQFDFSTVKAASVTVTSGRQVIANTASADLGLRFRF